MHASFDLVVGLGKTGQSIARYLSRKHKPFIVFDTRKQVKAVDAFRSEFPGVDVFLGDFPEALFPRISALITSPGVSLDEPIFVAARKKNIPIYGDIECLAQAIKAPVIAITGTNGKSTVTTLVGEMARAAGMNVAVAGNIGTPVLDLLDNGIDYDLWVLELSSFQLDLTFSLQPLAATILNVTPDHLDRHHDFDAYMKAKQRIYHQATVGVYNRADTYTKPLFQQPSSLVSYGLDEPADKNWGIKITDDKTYLAYSAEPFLCVDSLKIKGRHNWENALAACALASAAQISLAHQLAVLKNFEGLPHRCQWVRTLDDVHWINDSKGTNVGATLSAISGIGASMPGKVILIAGGQGKGADFRALREPVQDYVRSVVLIGEDAPLMADALTGVVDVYHALSLADAVLIAKKKAQVGDVVLLSPACASFDMFRDFNHRGESFIEQVNAL